MPTKNDTYIVVGIQKAYIKRLTLYSKCDILHKSDKGVANICVALFCFLRVLA